MLGQLRNINAAFLTMKIDTAEAQADFLGNAFGESGSLGSFSEIDGDKKDYAPFYGRGAVQVTFEEGYAQTIAYIDSRAKQLAAELPQKTAAGAPDHELAELQRELDLCTEAVVAIKG